MDDLDADLDATQLLSLVRGIHLPTSLAEPPVWPIFLAGVFIALALAALLFSHYQKRNTWAAHARRELRIIEQNDHSQALEQIASLLRRVVLTHDNTHNLKHLAGQPWLNYLNRFFNTLYFTKGEGKVFGDALYQENTQVPANLHRDLHKLIRRRNWQQ